MRYDNYEETLRSFPHWYDKNYDSNFSKTVRVLNKQYHDKYQKIRALDYAKRLIKPIKIHKEQSEEYEYTIVCEVDLPNLKEVNFYVNPIVDDDENIKSYEKCITKKYEDDGLNNKYYLRYYGDTRKEFESNDIIFFDDYEYVTDYNLKETEENDIPIIPYDTFILEVYTYDDYHWLKGFPENDNEDLYKIYKETKSYTDYLTFEIKKQNIRNIQIFKDDNLIYDEDLYKKQNDGQLIYHDYQQSQVVVDASKDILVADPDKEEYVIRVILTDDDFDEAHNIKSNFDLMVTLYDKNNPYCQDKDKTVHKRYNGNEKTNYDCFTHDYSLDMIGKWWNVPRLNLSPPQPYFYNKTYPPYNNRLTEDDYNYQNRILTYIEKYNNEIFPVVELWKNYQVWGSLRNRKDILSVQDHSYLDEYLYYENTNITEESHNLLNIVEGQSKEVTIQGNNWYEILLADNLYVVPNTEYKFTCRLEFNTPVNNKQINLHIYYLNGKGDCINEEVYELGFKEESVNIYIVEQLITTREDSVKIDVVIESDIECYINDSYFKRRTIADKSAMYMTTKKDYNSCVYDLTIQGDDVPSNINFDNTLLFEKLLQRSFPLTHKCFLNMYYDYSENLTLNEKLSNVKLNDYFDETNKQNTEEELDNHYIFDLDYMIKENCHYTLTVAFKDEIVDELEWEDYEAYVKTSVLFKEYEDDNEPLDILEMDTLIKANYWTTLTYHFTIPLNAHHLILDFQSTNGHSFYYKDLTLRREEPLELDELWN